MSNPRGTLGHLIRERRREYRLTQEQLAEKVGVSQNYIAKIETGFSGIGPKTLTRLSIALDIPTENLIEYHLPFYSEGVAELIEKRIDYDSQFKLLPTRLKELLLKMAPILEKYM